MASAEKGRLRAVAWSRGRLLILDQTRLPGQIRYLRPDSARAVVGIIKRLAVRGAPAIGVAAAYGLALEARRLPDAQLRPGLERAARWLVQARPTAVNLKHAVDRVIEHIHQPDLKPAQLRQAVLAEAQAIETEETARSQAMARHGLRLIPDQAHVLTICNTGALAAPGLGTALGVVLLAHRNGRRVHVYACETRPLLQGSRLTVLELQRAGVPVTLIVDSAAATVIDRCDLVLVGADRIAANGDTANKVGTRMLALLAQAARRPFYVVAPVSTFDPECPDGTHILVEERNGEEVRRFRSCRAAGPDVPVFNPAFDITPAQLITGFVTEQGIIRPGLVKRWLARKQKRPRPKA
ncbi:MAG: S-methyl-5-thioribose-1-phosphate isomerase [candidate division WOR-3 bacterium]